MLTEKQRQIKNTIIYTLPLVITSILPLVTLPIFTRILTPNDYGNLGLAMVYASVAGGLSNFGMSLVFDRNFFQYNQDKIKLSKLFYSSLLFIYFNFIILLCLTVIYRENISTYLTGTIQNSNLILITLCAFFIINISNNFFYILFKNSEKAEIFSKFKIIETLLNTIIALLLVVYFRIGVIGIVYGQLIAGLLLFSIFINITLKELPFYLSISLLLESLKISYPLTPKILIGIINTQFDKFMIGMLATVNSVGIYHIAKRISEIIFNFMTVLQNVYHPQVYKRMFDNHEQGSESIGSYLTPFLYISTSIALSVALFSEEILTLLTPLEYHKATPIISILSIYYGSMFFGKIPQLMYAKKTHIISILIIFSTVLNITLNIPFIIKYGAIGAAWATLISGLISGITSLIISQHYYRILYEWGKVLWIMGNFFCGSSIITVMLLLNAPYTWNIIVKIIVIVIYIAIGIKYDVISRKNMFEIKSVFLQKISATNQ